MITLPQKTLWLPPARVLLDRFAFAGRIRRGGKRLRVASGGRSRDNACCCIDCEECENLIGPGSTLQYTLGGVSGATVSTVTGSIVIECEQDNLNSTYSLDWVFATNFEVLLGTLGDYGDAGIRIRTIDFEDSELHECFAYKCVGEVSCGICDGEDGLVATVGFVTHAFADGVFNPSGGINACDGSTVTVAGGFNGGCCPNLFFGSINGATPVAPRPCRQDPTSCHGVTMTAAPNTFCSSYPHHSYTSHATARLFV